MKPYLDLRTAGKWNDHFCKCQNIPFPKLRNRLLKKFRPDKRKSEYQIPALKSRTTIKNNWKKDEGLC